MVWLRFKEGYPRIWADFTCEKTKQRFIIKDLSKEYYDIALGYMTNMFLTESAICKPLRILEDPVSRSQMQLKWLKIMKSNMAIVCCTDDDVPCRVAAIHFTTVKVKEPQLPATNPSTLSKYDEFAQVVEDLMLEGDLFNRYGEDQYLWSLGLFVLPEFRGKGIATQLLKARITMCKALGLPGTANVFSTPGAQAAARSAGYQELATRVYSGQRLAVMGTAILKYNTMGWQRPIDGYPRIWADFTCEKTKQRFIIKDLSKEYYDIAFGYMTNMFLTESFICKLSKDPIFRVQLQRKWLNVMKSNMAIICCTDDEVPRVAAIHFTAIRTKELPQPAKDPSTLSEYDQLSQVLEDLKLEGDVFTRYGADHYLSSIALFVLPEFRGQGIATQLLKFRITMCRALGLSGTANVFGTCGGQAAARSAGYQEFASRDYNGQRKLLMGTPKLN